MFALGLLPTEPPPPTVPARVAHKLKLFTPGEELVDAYLWEIAKSYKVDWVPAGLGVGEGEGGDREDHGGAGVKEEGKEDKEDEDADDRDGDGGDRERKEQEEEKECQTSPKKVETAKETKLTEEEELAQRFERLKNL